MAKYYNRTNTCNKCGINFIIANGSPCREYNKEGNWAGNWLCHNCYIKDYQRCNPNSLNNTIKSLANHRTGNLDLNCTSAKGDKFQKLTCEWLKINDLNIEHDNFCFPIDHSKHEIYGIVQTQGRFYDSINRCWNFDLRKDLEKLFDNMICYCANKNGENIERIYIFPWRDMRTKAITIVKNPSRGIPWYEQYRVDEEICKQVNKIYLKIM
jgi:hypothetical protein